MIVIVSNRNVNPNADDHRVFGDKPNAKGLNELRVANAEYNGTKKKWKVILLPEKRADLDAGNPPSRQLFRKALKKITTGALSGDWVFFVHGFNQSFKDNLEKCRKIQQIYGVNVIAFSWPSNQGGNKLKEYKTARGAARNSTMAFDRTLEKLAYYLARRPHATDCKIRLSLMTYSMGNYLFENFVRDPVFCDETQIFDNVVLTQADVDVDSHADWVEALRFGKRVIVTINEDDSVLKWSDVVNPPRLGNTLPDDDEIASGAVYFDFTDGAHVGSTHGVFYKTATKNPVVRQFFSRALTGGRPERIGGIVYRPGDGVWELADKAAGTGFSDHDDHLDP